MMEQVGLQPVANNEKTRGAKDLFWIWFAANLGILGVVFGALIDSFQVGLWESIAIAFIGSLSFVLVGMLSVAGRDAGQPMMALSAKVFGTKGNSLLALWNWVNLLGWEAVAVLTGTYAMQAILSPFVHTQMTLVLALCGGLFLLLFLVLALYGFHLVLRIQKFVGYVFGILTLFILVAFFAHGVSVPVAAVSTGVWWEGGLAALSLIFAGTSISWAMAASDYSRYLSRQVKTRSVVWAVTLGGGIPLFVLLLTGILLADRVPQLMTSANPILTLSALLPVWMQIPYLIVVIGGLLAEAVLGFYSSGFSLLAMGVRIPRPRTAWIDFLVSLAAIIYGLSHPANFLGTLEGFLSLIGVGLASWTGIFLVHEWRGHSHDQNGTVGMQFGALGVWGFVTLIGVLFTATPVYTGPYAKGIFAQSNLGLFMALLLGGIIYYILLESRVRMAGKMRVWSE
jgi:purine-cytosine permease-like protein